MHRLKISGNICKCSAICWAPTPLFDFSRFPCYNSVMITMQQTVDIPASHRLTIEVPQEVPTGKAQVIIRFPAETGDECPLCAVYNEPNEETIAAFEEGDAMLRGEIPVVWHHSEDLDKMLGL
ncbi:MAG: hypothetical protein Ta2A_14080 [Treponemataceae bacterium]|nr:MAG: hypothetical protein Ta2A_14080 [Treponemataceae bacterium]